MVKALMISTTPGRDGDSTETNEEIGKQQMRKEHGRTTSAVVLYVVKQPEI